MVLESAMELVPELVLERERERVPAPVQSFPGQLRASAQECGR